MEKFKSAVSKSGVHDNLVRLENRISDVVAHPFSLLIVVGIILAWLIVGNTVPIPHEKWQDMLHVPVFIVTFILLFILQHSQKKDTEALQAKLDELIKSMPAADDKKIELENKLKKRKN